jgi:hypothetical protein
VNPLSAHWLRITLLLAVASPLVALMVALTAHVGFTLAMAMTLYMWGLVCVILALIAAAGVCLRVLQWGIRALRR